MLDGLKEDLAAFSSFDLLAKVGALSLAPRNASRPISLEVLAHLVAALPYRRDAPLISLRRLKLLVERHLGEDSEPGRHDDPASNMFTEEIVWSNGPYVVCPGTWAGGHDCLTWLLRSIGTVSSPIEVQDFRDEAIRAAIVCLSVSNAIARKAGISRGIPPQLERELDIPHWNAMKMGSNAVTFSKADLVALLGEETYFDETVDPLTANAGDVDWEGYSFGSGDLHQTPFVKFGDHYVVPIPSSLLLGLLHRVLNLALEHGVSSDLSHSFREAIWAELEILLGMSRSAPLPRILPNPSPTTFLEGLFTLDSDKLVYVQLTTDDWNGSTGQIGPARWDVSRLWEDLNQRNTNVKEHLKHRV